MSNDPKAIIPAQPHALDGAIQAAVALGPQGVETLRQLYAIEKERRADDARAAFFLAMSELHARIGSIPKNRTASFATKAGARVSYRYADLHAIASALRKHTGPLGLAWRWESSGDDGGVAVTCTASHRDGHSVSSVWRAPIEGGNPLTSAPQKAKIATTFAQRVTLIQVFGLTDTEDDVDGAMPEGRVDEPESMAGEPDEGALANVRALMDEVGGDPKRFLAWLGVARVDDLRGEAVGRAVAKLEAFRKEGRSM